MSGVFKAIGKVFKAVVSPLGTIIGGKVGKTITKITMGALMVGAVVLTGGAALGALPAVGTVLGGLGLSAGLTTVLTGAVTAGALGAGLGGLTAAISGKNIFNGAETGFIGGAISGGVLGAVSPASIGTMGIFGGAPIGSAAGSTGLETLAAGKAADGLLGVASAAGSTAPAAASVGAGLIDPASLGVQGTIGDVASAPSLGSATAASTYAPAAASAPTPYTTPTDLPPGFGGGAPASGGSAAASGSPIGPGTYLDRAASVAHSGGLLSSATTPLLMQTIGSAVSGLGQGAAASQAAKDAAAARRFEADRVAFNYGYQNLYPTGKDGKPIKDADPNGLRPWYSYASAIPTKPTGLLASGQQPPRGYYAISGNQVVFVPTGA